ncbi:hypothetical protein KIY73_gp74 [Mycobacterium phage Camperdownii]|uniref:Uncharacterized protein n=1 Tax=Mycobacterium phage Camperdownii TaxID=1927024 RepID=A0A1L5C0N6_9CAUD|nr:hypothetical protein KIY73_gp74 [Mycobacterium phage Camperdownii]APL99668.1 hypothetical protein SEA_CAMPERDOWNII_74 [Mycobacterium phage Camperdownii]
MLPRGWTCDGYSLSHTLYIAQEERHEQHPPRGLEGRH